MDTIRCCMAGCDVSSKDRDSETKKSLYVFPKDFNLCMLWVQNSGRPEFFEDFAFAGAQPFLKRHICNVHFSADDFVNSDDPSLGLLPSAVPNSNFIFTKIEVKEEQLDAEYTEELEGTLLSERELLTDIKIEKFENDHCDEVCTNFSFSSTDESCNDSLLPRFPPKDVYQETEEEKELSNEFFRKYESAMRVNTRRMNETAEDRARRLKREALRARQRRSEESEEQKTVRRMKNALRAAFRRRNETPEQRELRKKKDMLRAQRRRKAETEAEARIRKYNDAVRAAFRRNNETEEQRMERKMKDIVRAAKRRSMETPEQREMRLRKDRERASKRRLLKRIAEQMSRLDGLSDVGQVTLPTKQEPMDNGSQPITMSSISSIANQCNESSHMNRLQQVLEFIESKTSKSKRKTQKPGTSEANQRPAEYVNLVMNPTFILVNSIGAKKDCINDGCLNSQTALVQDYHQLTDVPQSPTNSDATSKNLVEHEYEYVESKVDGEEIMDLLEPEVVWG